ncbi:hypothetical protein SNOG_09826 [Parastagonospora nodorum SN15]|uniref:Uncharacterized protein n=1 Tax=Phaeosphaeria nodorum (strain SN15 / ATCC MYA-4574 / FGSC 10173) TaxID=321614 RepID=Q0UEI8_PHANO|nr:hypothetical protein SNOG_09826 [Parastagonospora nodorum SN15]EAT83091.1 hypothetical protein SNOG_09826 [Parastagonospora nodorum SN15]
MADVTSYCNDYCVLWPTMLSIIYGVKSKRARIVASPGDIWNVLDANLLPK